MRVKQIQVPRRRRQVHGLEAAAAFLVQDIEALHQANEIAHFGVAAVAAAVFDVHDVSRAADRGKHRVAVADAEVPLRITRLQSERRRGQGDELLDAIGVEEDARFGGIDCASGPGVKFARAAGQHQHADIAQDLQPGAMDLLHLVRAEQHVGSMPIAQLAPGWLGDGAAGAQLARAAAALAGGHGRATSSRAGGSIRVRSRRGTSVAGASSNSRAKRWPA